MHGIHVVEVCSYTREVKRFCYVGSTILASSVQTNHQPKLSSGSSRWNSVICNVQGSIHGICELMTSYEHSKPLRMAGAAQPVESKRQAVKTVTRAHHTGQPQGKNARAKVPMHQNSSQIQDCLNPVRGIRDAMLRSAFQTILSYSFLTPHLFPLSKVCSVGCLGSTFAPTRSQDMDGRRRGLARHLWSAFGGTCAPW